MSDSRRSGLSGESAVMRLVQQAQAAQAEEQAAAEGKDGRGRPGHAGELGRDKTRRAKITLDLPVDQQNRLRELAEAEDVILSDLASLAIARLLADVRAGRVDLDTMKSPARSLKASWKLAFSEEGGGIKK